jgi:hypothetical protein
VNGGTGFTSYAAGEILFAESASTLKKLPIGPFGAVLRVAQPGGTGTPLVPSWATTGPGTVTEVQFGGTGLNSLTPGGVLIGEVDKYHELGKWGFNVNYNGWHGARSMSKELLELIIYEMNMLDN